MDYQKLLENVEVLVAPVLESIGFELIEREFLQEHGQWILRLYIDREGEAISIADCKTASRALEPVLDVENLIPGSYALEVSSPGLDRPLRRLKDFERFKGSWISLKTQHPIDGRHNFVSVELMGIESGSILIKDGEKEWRIPLEALKKAKIKGVIHGHHDKTGKKKS